MKKRTEPTKSKRVKAVARERLGSPKAARVIADKRLREKPKHKKTVEVES